MSRSNRDIKRAVAIFIWVVSATRPLTVGELTVALLVKDDDRCRDLEVEELPDFIDEDYVNGEILDLCGSFLEVCSTVSEEKVEARTVNIVHFSAKEYLSAKIAKFQQSDQPATKAFDSPCQSNYIGCLCLRHLNYKSVWRPVGKDEIARVSALFLTYASQQWSKHILSGYSNSAKAVRLVNSLFSPHNSNWYFWRERYECQIGLLILNRGADPERTGGLLYYAARLGLNDTIPHLVQNDIEPITITGGYHGSPLQAACAKGNFSTVQLLVSLGAELNVGRGIYGSAISTAIAFGHTEIVRHLIMIGTSLSTTDHSGSQPVHLVAELENMEIVRLLIENGAPVSCKDEEGRTPLLLAALSANAKIALCLLQAGAAVDCEDDGGETPLMIAVQKGHIETGQVLLDYDGKNIGFKSLHTAARGGHLSATVARGDYAIAATLLLDSYKEKLLVFEIETRGTLLMCTAFHGFLNTTRILDRRRPGHCGNG